VSGKHHLSPAEREEKAHLCYELSLKGMSTREIGAHPDVQLSHPTVANLIGEEGERRRSAREDARMRSVAMKMKTVERMWAELDSSPSAHAVAQLGHALRGLLADVDLITGVRAPTKTANVHHHIVENIRDAFYQTYFRALADDEFTMFELLYYKTPGDHHAIPQDVDVVKLAFEYYQRNGSLEGLDAESLCVPREGADVPDFPPKELEGGW
jgi:hypothetical protein